MRREAMQRLIAMLGRGLHQDALIEGPSPHELARDCLRCLSAEEKQALKPALEFALAKYTDAELKGVLNRIKADIGFGSKGARPFLDAALKQLS